jgi:hypothetical protein
VISARPEGPVLCFVGAFALLASTVPRWFSVLIEYPGDQVRNDYGILALDRGSLHSYTAFGWAFELLIALAPIVAVLATLFGDVVDTSAKAAANAVIASGMVALGVVVVATVTFEIANPRSDGFLIGSDSQLGPGAIAAALPAGVIIAGGVVIRRAVSASVGR